MPEPTAALGLWPAIKAYSGWPETDETRMQALAETWTRAGSSFQQAAGFSSAPGVAAWGDQAGQEFTAATGRTTGLAGQSGADTVVLSRAAGDFAQVITGTKFALTDLVNQNLPIYAALKALPAGIQAPFEALFVAQVAQFAQSVMTEATAQAAAAGAVRVSTMPAAPTPAGGGPPADPLTTMPPPGSDPAAVARWWNTIPEHLKLRFAQLHPELVGNLNGVPARFRHAANVIVLERRRSELRAERGRLQAELSGLGGPGSQHERFQLEERIAELDGTIRGLDEIHGIVNSPDPQGRPPALLLGLDTTGRGKFIISRGDPDQAAHVATFIPGTGAELSKAGGQMRPVDALYDAARRSGNSDTAVIAWMDYETPSSIPAAISEDRAAVGADRLVGFQESLRATHSGPPSHNTVVGHSYGSTVAGMATSGPHYRAPAEGVRAPIDDVIAAGSPGLGTDHASEHSVGADRVWVIESPHDWVADASTAGEDPSTGSFGARVYNSEPGPPTSSIVPPSSGYNPYAPSSPRLDYRSDAHSSYFTTPEAGAPPNAGLDRMGNIITGRPPD